MTQIDSPGAGVLTDDPARGVVLLRAAGVALLVDTGREDLPRVLHWGADPGPLDGPALRRLADDLVPAVPNSGLDAAWPFTLLPGQADGWSGTPGVSGCRDGGKPFPHWRTESVDVACEDDGSTVLCCRAVDSEGGLAVVSLLRLEPSGLLRVRHELTDLAGGYRVDGVLAGLPVPDQAVELLDLTGRWCRERGPQRRPFQHGTSARLSRRGRTGHDATLLLAAGTPGFGFRHGEVWAVHTAWSGNHVHLAERLPEGAGSGGSGVLSGGELLLPGEIRLAAGQTYSTPWVCFTYSADGLDGASAQVHRWLRSRPEHPRRPRPLTLNSWEAVYFDHDFDRLAGLARVAAKVGVERFVLDDGWFLGRRDEDAGLGDWYVDEAVWPQGLRPLADLVRDLGMEFGLWVEPEMVNPDSRLAREHPDWLVGNGSQDYLPRPWRRQQVLDVTDPGAYAYLLSRLDGLVDEIGIAYLKWDHNRDLHEATRVHEQTLAVYRLLDELRARHPGLEIESCSSGGARVDLGILARTDRIWASDTNDPVERQAIQRWTGLLLPPELVGAHVGPAQAHTTRRVTDLDFRCLTALFGHAGIEWDITTCDEAEQATLTRWTALYRELRHLLHTGDVVRADDPDSGAWLHGAVSPDGSEAVYAYLRLASAPDARPGRLRLPGLDAGRGYRVVRRGELGPAPTSAAPAWWQRGEALTSGDVLAGIGLPGPLLNPGEAVLLHVRAR
ncbi:MAG TPA: alpha-galactosidase [Kineosporiaceae bacterium]|nr:alpha-galactosidase [Kineosporiaceae bacterium]